MNLHGIVSGAIGTVNPHITALVRYSNGYTVGPSGKQIPAYIDAPGQMVQMQALSGKDLAFLANLNIQGVQRALYMYGDTQGIVRPKAKGGDLIVVGTDVWKVITVLETWLDWSKVGVTLQVS